MRREWQMERAFQTALWLLRPEVVFILGDIFDEGKWSSKNVSRARSGVVVGLGAVYSTAEGIRQYREQWFQYNIHWLEKGSSEHFGGLLYEV